MTLDQLQLLVFLSSRDKGLFSVSFASALSSVTNKQNSKTGKGIQDPAYKFYSDFTPYINVHVCVGFDSLT